MNDIKFISIGKTDTHLDTAVYMTNVLMMKACILKEVSNGITIPSIPKDQEGILHYALSDITEGIADAMILSIKSLQENLLYCHKDIQRLERVVKNIDDPEYREGYRTGIECMYDNRKTEHTDEGESV